MEIDMNLCAVSQLTYAAKVVHLLPIFLRLHMLFLDSLTVHQAASGGSYCGESWPDGILGVHHHRRRAAPTSHLGQQ